MKIIPILGQILVKPEPIKETIIRPDNSKLQPDRGEVIESSISEVVKGDHVIFKDLTGVYVEEYILVNISDILVVYGLLPGRNTPHRGHENGS
jgi:co-chaperonin GroES (HSP10)